MQIIAKQEVEIAGQSGLAVNGERSWKIHGHSSKVELSIRLVLKIKKKLFDIDLISSFCKVCETRRKKNVTKLQTWKTNHEKWRVKNHVGVSKNNESEWYTEDFWLLRRNLQCKISKLHLNYITY